MDLAKPGTPDTWADVVPQHDKDLLQWAAALKVPEKSPFTKLFLVPRMGSCFMAQSGPLVVASTLRRPIIGRTVGSKSAVHRTGTAQTSVFLWHAGRQPGGVLPEGRPQRARAPQPRAPQCIWPLVSAKRPTTPDRPRVMTLHLSAAGSHSANMQAQMQLRWQRLTPSLLCAAADPPPVANMSALQADGNLRSVLPLPGIGSVNGFSGQRKHSQAFFKFTSFTEPGAIFRRDMT